MFVLGRASGDRPPGPSARAGVAVIPEDRHDSGCVLDMSVAENLVMIDLPPVSPRGCMDRDGMDARRAADAGVRDHRPLAARADAVAVRRQPAARRARPRAVRRPTALFAAQPTRGLDVGAVEHMTDRLRAAAASGVGILLISTELEEVLSLVHRVCVIHNGRSSARCCTTRPTWSGSACSSEGWRHERATMKHRRRRGGDADGATTVRDATRRPSRRRRWRRARADRAALRRLGHRRAGPVRAARRRRPAARRARCSAP